VGVVGGEQDQPNVPPSPPVGDAGSAGIRAGQPLGPTLRETIDNLGGAPDTPASRTSGSRTVTNSFR
jgi:hypothetical protein